MTPTVDLSFRYSENDFVRAMRLHYATRLRPKADGAVAVICAVVGFFLWHSSSARWLAVFCIAASCLLIMILVAAFGVIPSLVFRREPKFRDDYSLAFSADGIHFRTAHIDSRLEWSMYSRALVDSHSYVLYYGKNSFTVITKRVFQNPEQLRVFEELLAKFVPEIVRRDK
jgi:hypothetical protein